MTVPHSAGPGPVAPQVPRIAVAGLSAWYGQRRILHDVSFDAAPGTIVALIGRNGAGKSTTLLAIAGHVARVEGLVTVDGEEVAGPPHERSRRFFSLAAKGNSLFGSLSLRDNIELAGVSVDEFLSYFPELAARTKVAVGQLSGGQQQLVSVGRALLRNPRVALLDELTVGLSPAAVSRLVGVVRELVATRGLCVVAVEQHLSVAERLADHIMVLGDGHVRLSLDASDVVARGAEIEEVYLGRPSETHPRGTDRTNEGEQQW